MSRKYQNTDYPLTELHRSGFEVADGYPDIRGWNIVNGVGQKLGEVVELIFDPLSKSVRYLVVHIDGKPINLLSRDVLIPVGLAQLVEETGMVSVPSVTVGHLALLPAYKRKDLDRSFERTVRNVFTGEKAEVIEEEETDHPVFYEHDHFNQEKFYGKRNIHNIQEINVPPNARVREKITPVEKPVQDTREDYRQTPSNIHEPFKPFREGSIELTEHAEVPVVRKEARVVEEVKVNKDISEREEVVRDNIRKTEVDIERISKKDLE